MNTASINLSGHHESLLSFQRLLGVAASTVVSQRAGRLLPVPPPANKPMLPNPRPFRRPTCGDNQR